jgi:hypothetical protein
MTNFGSSNENFSVRQNERLQALRRSKSRQMLLETLEDRQLLTGGPTLIGVQSNEGSLLQNGSVLNVSPRELVFRFDNSTTLDADTLGAIQLTRAGGDGVFERAYVSTDLGSGGGVVVDFAAAEGTRGDGVQVEFSKASRTDTRAPRITVVGQRIQVEVNTAQGFKTRAQDLVDSLRANGQASQLILPSLLRGNPLLEISDTVAQGAVYELAGSNSARSSTNFNSGASLQVEFIARQSGAQGQSVQINFTRRDFGSAGGPNISVNGSTVNVELNSSARFTTTAQDVVDAINENSAASDLVLARFVSGAPATRVGSAPINYSPIQLQGAGDVPIVPGYVGFGDSAREVVFRFAEPLPDDAYRVDILGEGPLTLLDVDGDAYNHGISTSFGFQLDLGAQILSVVPQPIARDANGVLTQARDRIRVYFNNDDLDIAAAEDVSFYQLRVTQDTATTLDDFVIFPSSVTYSPTTDMAELTFAQNLDQLVDGSGNALPTSVLRLRIGSDSLPLPAPAALTPASDPGSSFDTAIDLTANFAAGSPGSVVVSSEIQNVNPYLLDFPGANDEIGNRDIRYQDHVTGVDSDGIEIIQYNFQVAIGTVAGSVQQNAITETQKGLVREAITLYEKYLGVRFVETTANGLTFAVGDMRAVVGGGLNAPGGARIAAGQLASNGQPAFVVDSQDLNAATQNEFGSELFQVFMQGIGFLLGLGRAEELPPVTVQSDQPVPGRGVETELQFPGNADIVHGQFVHRPEGTDIDLYRFSLPTAGQLSVEIFAQRSQTPSLLDSAIRLYQLDSDGEFIEIAANDDYFSQDSRIQLDLAAGTYALGVSAKGNETYDPNIEDSGLGGRSEGNYDVRFDFRPPTGSFILDQAGDGGQVAIDGDSDGRPGGTHDFWFVANSPTETLIVDKAAPAGGNGTLAAPYKLIKDALDNVTAGQVIRIVGNGGADGRMETQDDNLAYELGFNRLNQAQADGVVFNVPADVTVMIDQGAILKLSRARIGVGSTSVSVDRSGGALQVLGVPRLMDTAGNVISDLSGNPVPGNVYFTSLNSPIGVGTNRDISPPAPRPGDWGGIDFRNDIDGGDQSRRDLERDGLFVNTVTFGDLRYGGGQVSVDGPFEVITPIQMIDARPTISGNTISQSADAALSATPNSFLESNFVDPTSQAGGAFIPDFERVGPDIHGNRLIDNSLNGLFIDARTTAGSSTEALTVSGRFDDTDVVHIVSENLIIAGATGGAIQETAAPPTSIVTLADLSGGSLAAGDYRYRITYVDAQGGESPASEPTAAVTVGANGRVQLRNLPPIPANLNFVARRLYRSEVGGSGTFSLVGQINAISTTFVDAGTNTGATLVDNVSAIRPRLAASLVIDPGSVVKLRGSRIEVEFGGSLIAEGLDGLPVVFTSLNDISYGAGGTFDTSNRGSTRLAAQGDWGGIYAGHASTLSLDYARVNFGGGTTVVDGGFASFNAVEIHQADARISNSRFERNADGREGANPTDRVGRGTNFESTIFVRASQPIIVDNRIVGNEAAAISVDVNSINSEHVNDIGRQTGAIDKSGEFLSNQGPLIRENRIDNNGVNGLVVRGQAVTTQSVWDDTDIVHVVQDQIDVSNFHTYGGVRLVSKDTESLVVKLGGVDAGFAVNGVPLDIDDRIGGSLQVIGNASAPVVMTSINDCDVGAGFTPDGRPQLDTLNTGLCGQIDVSVPFADIIVVVDESASMGFAQEFSVDLIADIEADLQAAGIGTTGAGGNLFGLVGYGNFDQVPRSIPVGANGALFGTSVEYAAAAGTLTVDGAIEDGYQAIDFALNTYTYRPAAAKFVLLITNEDRDIVDDTFTFATTLDDLDAQGITLNGIVGADFLDANGQSALGLDGERLAYLADGTGGFTTSPNGTIGFRDGTTEEDYINLSFATDGIVGDINQISEGGLTATSFSSALTTTIVTQAGGSLAQGGDWGTISFETYSNDRNVAAVSELEPSRDSAINSNNIPSRSQYLGGLASSISGGDENRRLGFEVQGVLSSRTDLDTYSFTARGGTEVWLDIDRTQNSLDSVVELIDANGKILALSDNSFAEENDPTLLFSDSSLGGNSVNPLRKAPVGLADENSRGDYRDLYSTNPADAGLRVVLPGLSTRDTLYHVRVRSSSLSPGDSPADLLTPESLANGRSRGAYQLQIRLGETDEIPGSSIDHADIRYAQTGVNLEGVPRSSPLAGETAEIQAVDNNTIETAQNLGNLLNTDRQAISLAGSLDSPTDVDWYQFEIDYDLLVTPLAEYFSTIFDIDYADGIGRPDTSLYLYNSEGQLVTLGLDSNILDDRSTTLNGADNTDLGRGSIGALDAYIGATELAAGQYFLAVTNSSRVPAAFDAFTNPTTATPFIRLQPASNTQFIVEDHIDFDGGSSGVRPVVTDFLGANAPIEYTLGDVPLYVTTDVGFDLTDVLIINPFSGERSNNVGRIPNDIQDVAFQFNGTLRAFDTTLDFFPAGADRDGLIDYLDINYGDATITNTGTIGIETSQSDLAVPPVPEDSNVGINVQAITFADIGNTEVGFVIGNRGFGTPAIQAPPITQNIVYQFDPNTGAAFSQPSVNRVDDQLLLGAGTDIVERFAVNTLSNPAAVSRRLVVTEATDVNSAGVATSLINDGTSFTLTDNFGFSVNFEFNSGREFDFSYDPAAGIAMQDGDQFSVNGVVYEFDTSSVSNVSPGAIRIFYSPDFTAEQFISAIQNALPAAVTVGRDGQRVNFSGATTSDFSQLVARGVASNLRSNSSVNGGSIAIDFLAQDTEFTIATRVARAINNAGLPGVNASANGRDVNIANASINANPNQPLRAADVAPGGLLTGTAVIGNTMYAVSNNGGLYRINNPTATGGIGGRVIENSYVNSSSDLLGIRFSGLTRGPRNVEGGRFNNLLFGTDSQGRIYAFNTAGELQPVFANGASSIQTGAGNITGLSFGNIDFNLFHQTVQRADDAGHGLPAPNDASRPAIGGGTSWYFGYENRLANGFNRFTDVSAPTVENTIDFPGGVSGVLESRTFSLAGISPADNPYLYYSYFLDTEDANSDLNDNDVMLDSFRVYASLEDGNEVLLTTNNSERGPGLFDDEFDVANSGFGETQENFDTAEWRQARVDLSSIAGEDNIRLRFEFSTAGGLGIGAQGGQSARLRVLAGNRVADGQVLQVSGQQFEIDLGITAIMPAGSQLTNGDTLLIDGTTFAFFNGTGTPPVADAIIPFTAADSPLVIAQSAANIIANTTPAKSTTSGLNFSNEGIRVNDTIPRATITPILGDSGIFEGSGVIGDNTLVLADADRDVDLIEMSLDQGAVVAATVRASSVGSALTPLLRIFDAEGNVVPSNSVSAGGSDRTLTFTAPSNGVYFIGVSASGNSSYNPMVAGTTTPGGSTGIYELSIDVTRLIDPVVSGGIIQLVGAKVVTGSANSGVILSGAFGSTGLAIPLLITDSVDQVAQKVSQAFADAFAGGVGNAYQALGSDVLVEGLNVTNDGPFGLIANRRENAFSEYSRNGNTRPATRAQNNGVEGLYLDDIMIGTTERGEIVLGGPVATTDFIANPEDPNGIVVGEYQLEIRGGSNYGLPTANDIILVDGFAPDERLVEGQNLTFQSAAQIADGSTFTISDGVSTITFEFDDFRIPGGVTPGNVAVPVSTVFTDPLTGLSRTMDAKDVAAAVRDVVNSPTVQSVLNVSVIMINGDLEGATSDTLAVYGNATVDINPAIGSVEFLTGNGDRNRERVQGQIVISNSRISNSGSFGIRVAAGDRDAESQNPNPGAVRNTIVLNDERLLPGAVIENNVLLFNRSGGIEIVGSPSTDQQVPAPVPYARVVNNTIVGGRITQATVSSSASFGNTFFANGLQSFADTVVDYNPAFGNGGQPIAGLQNAQLALGVPDYSGTGEPEADQGAVSLGSGGRIVLQFEDNFLKASGDASPDLFVSEVGVPEATLIEISVDGQSWTSVGRAGGGLSTIDIDAFGISPFERYSFVRITDDASNGPTTGLSVGADIDAVGAISSGLSENYSPGGTGISVSTSASPTLLNNVVVNTAVGIQVDASSQSTIIGGSLFQRNTADIADSAVLGDFAIVADENAPLFVDPVRGVLYPANLSPIIDSSVNSLPDRAPLTAVKELLGLADSPIIAPDFDSNGVLRVDDPDVDTPSGLGGNVFKDRGAIDRADSIGPSQFVVNPLDNDALGADSNSAEGIVELVNLSLNYFDIRLVDGAGENGLSQGSGVDDATVTSNAVLVSRNDVPLVEGRDYDFGYNPTSNTIRLTPLGGVWSRDAVYKIEMLNTREASVATLDPRDYADGSRVTVFDENGVPFVFEIELGFLINVPSAVSETQNVEVNDLTDGDQFTIDDGQRSVDFEIDTNGQSNSGGILVPISETDTAEVVARKIATAINSAGLNVQVNATEDGRVQILGSSSIDVNTSVINLDITGSTGVRPAYGLRIPQSEGVVDGVSDGQTFTITLGTLESETFEFDSDGSVVDGNIPVRLLTGSVDGLANEIVAAIASSGLGLAPINNGNGFIAIGGDTLTSIVSSNPELEIVGQAGFPAAIPISLNLLSSSTGDSTAQIMAAAINAANIPGVTVSVIGSRLFIEGSQGVTGTGASLIQPIRDQAGNPIRANRIDGTSVVEIFIGQGFDYGDAPDGPYATKFSSNGPRHSVVEGFSLGATVTADADARLVTGDDDDGVIFSSPILSGFDTTITVSAQGINASRRGFLSAWVDLNSDGVFQPSENIVDGRLLSNGDNILPPLRIPSNVSGQDLQFRFRYSSEPVSSPTGEAIDGEVEDYVVRVDANPYQNQINNLDVTGDGAVSPIDALRVINYINKNQVGRLPFPIDQALIDQFGQIDVDGNSSVNASDVLQIINFINKRGPSGEGEFVSSFDATSFDATSSIDEASASMNASSPLAGPSLSGSDSDFDGNTRFHSAANFRNPSNRVSEASSIDSQLDSILRDPSELVVESLLGELGDDVGRKEVTQKNVLDDLFDNDLWR